MSTFYLQIPGVNGGAPTAFPLLSPQYDKLTLTLQSQATGVFRFTADGTAMDANAIASEGTVCTILNGLTPIFVGRLFRVSRSGSGTEERIQYEVRDGWDDLGRVVYQQQWSLMASRNSDGTIQTASEYISELVLGQDTTGRQLTGTQVISQIITYANSCGALIQAGTLEINAELPFDNITDLTCAEAIKRVLRWTPNTVTWIDYTTSPFPSLNCVNRFSLTAVTLPFVGNVEQQNIEALPEMQPSGVIVNYLQENTSNDGPTGLTEYSDVYPETTSPQAFNAMVMTCRLQGSKSTYQLQPVVVAPIPQGDYPTDGDMADNENEPDGGPAGDACIRFWQRKIGWLKNFGVSSITSDQTGAGLIFAGCYITYNDGQDEDVDGGGNTPADLTIYPNELTSGTAAAWMNVKGVYCTVTGTCSYQYKNTSDSYTAADNEALKIFGGPLNSSDGTGTSGTFPVTSALTLTNAVTSTYSELTGFTAAEPVPAGLAETIYESVSALQYQGSYKQVNQDIGVPRLGIALNLSGGRGEWATMNALVKEIACDLDKGSTEYKFSLHGHLNLQDLMELIRANRTRIVSSHYAERTTGQSQSGTPTNGAQWTPTSGGSSTPDASSAYPWIGQQIDDDAGDDEDYPPYDVIFGYGLSSFADNINSGDGAGPPAPLQRFEIDVGNTGDGFSDGDYDGTENEFGLSLVIGDDDNDNDILAMWEPEGSIEMTPNTPSIELYDGLNSSDDGTPDGIDDTAHILLDYSQMLVELQDEDSSYLRLDLSDSPEIDIFNANSGSSNIIDENSLTITGGDSVDATITMTGGDSASVTIDTGDINGLSADFENWGTDDNPVYVLSTSDSAAGIIPWAAWNLDEFHTLDYDVSMGGNAAGFTTETPSDIAKFSFKSGELIDDGGYGIVIQSGNDYGVGDIISITTEGCLVALTPAAPSVSISDANSQTATISSTSCIINQPTTGTSTLGPVSLGLVNTDASISAGLQLGSDAVLSLAAGIGTGSFSTSSGISIFNGAGTSSFQTNSLSLNSTATGSVASMDVGSISGSVSISLQKVPDWVDPAKQRWVMCSGPF